MNSPRIRPALFALALLAATAHLPAQTPDAPAAAARPPVALAEQDAGHDASAEAMPDDPFRQRYGMSWREAWHHGGIIMWILLGVSVFGGALVIYFLALLRPAQVAPRALLGELLDRLQADDTNAARRACENRACPLAATTLTALDYIRGVSRMDVGLLRDMVESEGARQAEEMQSQTQLLLDVAVIAPMLGLLGTVFGMLKAFGSVAHDVAAAKPVILAEGVSQAIVTTIFGLIVAIPSMAFYAFFRRRAARLVALLETASTEILTALVNRQQP